MLKELKPPGQATIIIMQCFVANPSFGGKQASGVGGNLGEILFTAL